ncbi:MAG: GNAT family N-acetyltransferase [Halobacteriaceae archaeon]
MKFRAATPSDAGTVRDIARDSLSASYSPALDDDTIEAAVDQWYTSENIQRATEEDETALLLATEDDETLGFAKGVVVGRREPVGEIHWLHVAPEHRGRGVGARLLDRIEDELAEAGAERYAGFVLDVNEAGAGFYGRHGYSETGSRRIEIGDEDFLELEFGRRPEDGAGASPLQPVTVEGATRYVAYDEGEQGSLAPFYPLYNDRERESMYAYLCGNCETADVAVNSMGGYECNTCANRHKPSRWDAAYL